MTELLFFVIGITAGFWIGGGSVARVTNFVDWVKLKIKGP